MYALGISKELSSLHAEAFDLSEIRVYEKGTVSASTEAGNDFEAAVRPNTTEESATETNPEAVVDKNDLESQAATQNDTELAQELTLECPDLDVQEQQQVTSTENAGLEPIGEMEKIDSEAGNVADAVNSFDIPELELPSLVIGDKYDDPNASLPMDISCFSPEKIVELQPGPGVEDTPTVETENIGLDTVNTNDCSEIRDNVDDEKSDHNVSVVTSPRENGESNYLNPENGDKPAESILDVKLGEIDVDGANTADFVCDEKDAASLCLIDGAQINSHFSSGFEMDFKSTSFNEVVNPDFPEEADLLNIVDTEMNILDHPMAEDRGVCSNFSLLFLSHFVLFKT